MDDFDMSPAKFKRKPSLGMSSELVAINALTALMNSPAITGAALPEKEVVPAPAPEPVVELPPLPSNAGTNRNLLFFTGRIKGGKDYVAAAAGAKIFGFADPIYLLASHYFGIEITNTKNKDLSGMRAVLQTFGQWGRGTINEKYPLTPARALFIDAIRSKALALPASALVDWAAYGANENIWLDACLRRVDEHQQANPGARVAITNARFENEFKMLKAAGWRHVHVMCSPATWKARLAADGMTPESPVVRDISEAMAAGIDADVTKRISAQRIGSRLSVVWNDTDASRPSNRLHTLETFLKALGVTPSSVSQSEMDNVTFE